MADPRPVMDAAVLLLNTDPMLRAARDLTVAAMRGDFESDPKALAAATVIVASLAPPDDPTVIQLARTVAHHLAAYDAAVTALGYAVGLADVGEHTEARDRALAGMRAAFASGGFNGK